MTTPYNKTAPIIPAKTLGGLTIGDYFADVALEFVPDDGNDKTYSKWYGVADGSMRIKVDGRNGKICQLEALQGYTGTLFDEIRVGMRLMDALKRVPSLYYSSDRLYCRGMDGLIIELSEWDMPISAIDELTIRAITIFHPHTFTPHWLQGDWDTFPIPDQTPDLTSAQTYFERGNEAFALWELDKARDAYLYAVEHDPLFIEAHYQLACVFMEQNNDTWGAQARFSIVIELNPHDPRPYYQLGTIERATGDMNEAIRHYTQAIALQPDFADAYVGRGYVYGEVHHDYAQAIVEYDEALRHNPHHAQAYYLRGNAYFALGDDEKALADYDSTLLHQPNHTPAQSARARLMGGR